MHFGTSAIDRAKLEDIKTEMLSIKARAKIIADEKNYGDIEELKGNTTSQADLNKINQTDDEYYYTWDQATLEEQGLANIDGNKYIVHYDLDNPNNSEVYLIEGYEGSYSLTDLQER